MKCRYCQGGVWINPAMGGRYACLECDTGRRIADHLGRGSLRENEITAFMMSGVTTSVAVPAGPHPWDSVPMVERCEPTPLLLSPDAYRMVTGREASGGLLAQDADTGSLVLSRRKDIARDTSFMSDMSEVGISIHEKIANTPQNISALAAAIAARINKDLVGNIDVQVAADTRDPCGINVTLRPAPITASILAENAIEGFPRVSDAIAMVARLYSGSLVIERSRAVWSYRNRDRLVVEPSDRPGRARVTHDHGIADVQDEEAAEVIRVFCGYTVDPDAESRRLYREIHNEADRVAKRFSPDWFLSSYDETAFRITCNDVELGVGLSDVITRKFSPLMRATGRDLVTELRRCSIGTWSRVMLGRIELQDNSIGLPEVIDCIVPDTLSWWRWERRRGSCVGIVYKTATEAIAAVERYHCRGER